MSSIRILACFFLLISFRLHAMSHLDSISETSRVFQRLLDQLINLKTDENQVAPVHELILKRDVATFTLHNGSLILSTSVMEKTCALVFIGKGLFSFSPPTKIEKDQLHRFYEKDSLGEDFNFLFLLFADSTLGELKSKLTFGPGEIPNEAEVNMRYCMRYFTDPGKTYVEPDIAKALLERERNELFYAHFSREKRQPMCFEIDPYQPEEVSFARTDNTDHDERSFETISQFHLAKDYLATKDLSMINKSFLRIDTMGIDCTINNNLSMELSADLQFHFLKDNQSWIDILLSPKLEVDSVHCGTIRVNEFSKGKENPWLWIHYPEQAKKDDRGDLKIYYHGNILKKDFDFIYIETSTFWYPRYDVTQKSVLDLTFRTPERFTFVTVGERLSSIRDHGIELSHWRTTTPIRNASFNIGYFDQKTLDYGGIPPVTVLMSSTRHGMLDEVGADIANSLNFYQKNFGKSNLTHLFVSEIPYPNGEAFPGLVHLATETFENTSSVELTKFFGHMRRHISGGESGRDSEPIMTNG